MIENLENEKDSIFSIINKYIRKYTSLPTAETLVPLNPTKIPSYYMGSVLISDQRFGSKA